MLVYKYRGGSFKRDLKSLENNEFWASHTRQLNDPCEGMIAISDYEAQMDNLKLFFPQQSNDLTLLNQAFQNLIDMKDNKLGILSLSKSYDDELLWAHYADSHKGFCIEYDLEKLLAKQNPKHRFFNVQYSNQIPNLNFSQLSDQNDPDSLIKIMLGYKSQRWEYEDELRVITEHQGINIYDFRTVKSIFFGLRMADSEITTIMKSLQGRGVEYFQMHVKVNSFKFEAKKIPDQFPTNIKYKYSISPIAKLAVDPSTLKSEYKRFSPYLQKLAEIIRREPDCYIVNYIDLSRSKSTLNNPIFFAQYETNNDGLSITLHYSLQEIDAEYEKIDDL